MKKLQNRSLESCQQLAYLPCDCRSCKHTRMHIFEAQKLYSIAEFLDVRFEIAVHPSKQLKITHDFPSADINC